MTGALLSLWVHVHCKLIYQVATHCTMRLVNATYRAPSRAAMTVDEEVTFCVHIQE